MNKVRVGCNVRHKPSRIFFIELAKPFDSKICFGGQTLDPVIEERANRKKYSLAAPIWFNYPAEIDDWVGKIRSLGIAVTEDKPTNWTI